MRQCSICQRSFPYTRRGYSEYMEHFDNWNHVPYPIDEWVMQLRDDIESRAFQLYDEIYGSDADPTESRGLGK